MTLAGCFRKKMIHRIFAALNVLIVDIQVAGFINMYEISCSLNLEYGFTDFVLASAMYHH